MTLPPFDVVFLPTDFQPNSQRAFHHALFFTLETRGALRILHVYDGSPHERFPHVRETLTAWNRLEGNEELGIEVARVETNPGDPVERILTDVERHDPKLIVMATHGREGIARLLRKNVAEPVARKAHVPTLLLPPAAPGFISEWGDQTLNRILVPMATTPDPQLALEGVARLIATVRAPEGEVRLLYVNDGTPRPEPRVPEIPGWTFTRVDLDGEVVKTILLEAAANSVDCIVMASAGHRSASDWIFGSTAEQVLREATCAVLIMPSGS